jgi:uncharacterized protein (DUF58 family)
VLKRLLFKGYWRYSANRHWFLRRFTPAGVLAVSFVVALACLGADTNLAIAYQAFILMILVLSFSVVYSFRPKPKLAARRILPKTGSVGAPFSYRILVTNKGRRTEHGLAILENLSDPRPTLKEFLATPEPGEERRNGVDRAFGFYRFTWLLSRRLIATIREKSAPPIPPGSTREIEMETVPRRRGILEFAGLTAAKQDPFGLFRSLVHIKAPDKSIILPRRYPTADINLDGSTKYQPGGVSFASAIGESEEFISLREYRPGDSLRHLHWKSWAKTGKPIVKEFQDEFFVRHAMILDTFTDKGETDLFEEAVSVAASLACSLQAADSLLDLLFVGSEAFCFTAGRGLAHTGRLLEILAAVKTCPDRGFAVLERLVVDHISAVSGCVCVFLEWDEPRRRLVEQVQMRGLAPLVIVLTETEEPRLEPGPLASAPERFRQAPLSKVRETLLTL